jgi:hypothetical protein
VQRDQLRHNVVKLAAYRLSCRRLESIL